MLHVINDYNKELMNVYECIKDANKFDKMCSELNKHETNHSEEYYYQIRNLDRDKKKFNRIADYKRAARTLYLNKACFNVSKYASLYWSKYLLSASINFNTTITSYTHYITSIIAILYIFVLYKKF